MNAQFAPEELIANYQVSAISAGDIDGDGDDDLLTGTPGDSSLAWWSNMAGMLDGPRRIAVLGNRPTSIRAADLDGDGDADVLATTASGVFWFENTSAGANFLAARQIPTPAGSSGFIGANTADLDGDMHLDIVTWSGGIAWNENLDGRGEFGPAVLIAGGGGRNLTSLVTEAIYDLDRDGDLDVVGWIEQNIEEGRDNVGFGWYENDGAGAFRAHTVDTMNVDGPEGKGLTSFIPVDADGDGDGDLLTGQVGSFGLGSAVFMYENTDGQGTFGERGVAFEYAQPRSVFPSDVDIDGDDDIVVGWDRPYAVTYHDNADCQRGFTQASVVWPTSSSEPEPDSVPLVTVLDVNGDGLMDMVVGVDGTLVWREAIASKSGFCPPAHVATFAFGEWGNIWSIAGEDLDVDGDRDIVIQTHEQLGWHNNTDGKAFSEFLPIAFEYGRQLVTSDFDADGDPDILTGASTFSWHENEGSASSFGPPHEVGHIVPSGVDVADLDGDGDPDIVGGRVNVLELAWYENSDGKGAFGSPTEIPVQQAVTKVLTADLDSDGDNDIAVVGEKLFWIENGDGRGNFGSQRVIGSSRPLQVRASDVDGDGDSDIVVALPDTLAFYRNLDGRGSWGQLETIATGIGQTSSLDTGDLDEDGHDDFLYKEGEGSGSRIWWVPNSIGLAKTPASRLRSYPDILDGLDISAPAVEVGNSLLLAGSSQAYLDDIDGDGDNDVVYFLIPPVFVGPELRWVENPANPGLAPTQAPISLAPPAGATDVLTKPRLLWSTVPGAKRYEIQIGPSADFGSADTFESPITGLTPRSLDAASSYYLRVRGVNANGPGQWSVASRFSTVNRAPDMAPRLVGPIDAAVEDHLQVRLQWSHVSLAGEYEIQIDTLSQLAGSPVRKTSREDLVLRILEAGVTYHWRVRGANTLGGGPWSPAWSFTTALPPPSEAPRAAHPVVGSTTERPEEMRLAWTTVAFSERYTVHVDTTSQFSDPIVFETSLTWLTLRDLAPLTRYYWRVRAENETGLGAWSELSYFTTLAVGSPGRPRVIRPRGGGYPLDPLFEWEEELATRYEIRLDTSLAWNNTLVVDTITANSVRIGNLLPSTRYIWSVRGHNAIGVGPWSLNYAFTTGPPVSGPAILSPRGGETGVNSYTAFGWTTVEGARDYQIQVSKDAEFAEAEVDTTVSTTQASLSLRNLAPQVVYFWRVRGGNELGAGPWSQAQSFTSAIDVAVDEGNAIPASFRLSQNYPNPFNPTTRISYDLPRWSDVILRLFDLLGREIRVLTYGKQPAGNYEISLDATALPSGVYFYRLEAGDFVETKRMVLVR